MIACKGENDLVPDHGFVLARNKTIFFGEFFEPAKAALWFRQIIELRLDGVRTRCINGSYVFQNIIQFSQESTPFG